MVISLKCRNTWEFNLNFSGKILIYSCWNIINTFRVFWSLVMITLLFCEVAEARAQIGLDWKLKLSELSKSLRSPCFWQFSLDFRYKVRIKSVKFVCRILQKFSKSTWFSWNRHLIRKGTLVFKMKINNMKFKYF